jgi:hypothetical protein
VRLGVNNKKVKKERREQKIKRAVVERKSKKE